VPRNSTALGIEDAGPEEMRQLRSALEHALEAWEISA
jgi:hypothetical protein